MPTNRPLTVAALLLSMFMSALEATVVATAMPTVVGDLGGLTLYGWVGASYLLASTVSVPLYGRLADLRGRKPILLLGIVLFLAGSAASGAARTIGQLIAFRALQGLGAGALQPVTLTVLGDLYTPEERGRVQGLFGAVWGVAGVSGPLLGGLIVHWLGWRWVFFLNLPFGALALVVLSLAYREQRAGGQGAIDLPGAFLLTAASSLLLLGSSGGSTAPALLPGLALLLLFVVVEGRVAAPLLPMALVARRAMAVATSASALFGVAMMGSLIYAPLLVQEVRGGSPTDAGTAVAPMLVGWPIAATVTSKLIVRIGYRRPIQLGAWLVAAASAGFAAAVTSGASPWAMRAGMFVFGVGMGLANTAMIIAVQASVDWSQRGVATALNLFARSMGGTLGVGALGGILASHLAHHPEAGAARALDAAQRLALERGLGVVFWVIAAVALLNALLALLYPDDRPSPS